MTSCSFDAAHRGLGALDSFCPPPLLSSPPSVAEESPGVAKLIVHLKHCKAKPIEPGLEQTLKIAASGKEDYPGAKHEFDAWRGDALLNPPGLLLPVGRTHRLHHL